MTFLTFVCILIGAGYAIRDLDRQRTQAMTEGWAPPQTRAWVFGPLFLGFIGFIVGTVLTSWAA